MGITNTNNNTASDEEVIVAEAAPPLQSDAASLQWPPGKIPETEAWLPSRLLFVWVRPLFHRAAYLHSKDQVLQHDDLLPSPEFDHSASVGPIFEAAWQREMDNKKDASDKTAETPPLKLSELSTTNTGSTKHFRRALLQVMGWNFIVAGLIKAVNSGLQFCFPILLNLILAYIEDTQSGKIAEDAAWYDKYRGYWLAALLFLAMASKAITENAYFFKVFRSGYQAKVAISVAVYNKALRLANAERQSTTLGQLVNLMQVDATKIESFVPQCHVLWDGMLQICGYTVILYTLIGWPCFVGMVLIVLSGPLQGISQKKQVKHNHGLAKLTDSRVKTINEALQGIQCVKMYTWEESFEREINNYRTGELEHLKAIAYLQGFARSCMTGLPGLVAVVAFAVYTVAVPDASNSASTLFAALIAFNQLRFPLLFYPMALTQLSQARVSAARLETFLEMKEIGKIIDDKANRGQYTRDEDAGHGEIVVNNATIYWSDPDTPIHSQNTDDKDTPSATKTAGEEDSHDAERASTTTTYPKPILTDVSLRLANGELCAVIGRVASGKSTLCSAILNETILGGGEILLKGKVAFAAQSPWILNASIRDNILFGHAMIQEKYDKVVEACQLRYDFEMLDHGDLTEIGERGINLSGGQKARVSMARAAYSDADTIIMDDPLSALDPEVGRDLFDQCILKFMKGKTRLLVTNQLQFLEYSDNIVALANGMTIEQGSFNELNTKEGGEVKRILAEMASEDQRVEDKKDGDDESVAKQAPSKAAAIGAPTTNQSPAPEKVNTGLVSKEERAVGKVSISVYRRYILAGGGFTRFAVVYLAIVVCAANNLANMSWISFWTSDPGYQDHSEAFYLTIYALLSVAYGGFTFVRTFLLVRFGVEASGSLHAKLLASIFRAPQRFFDITPVGRILSRFSKDLHSIDTELSSNLDFFLWVSLQVLVSIGTIMFVTPWFGIAILPLGFIYLKILNYFREVSRETKRLDNISRSPVYAHFSETLGGLMTIRAYNQAERFSDSFGTKIDDNIRAWYNNKNADRWLSVRLEIMGAIVAGLAAAFATNVVLSESTTGQESNSNFASLAGLSLSFAIPLTGLLNWLIRWFAQLEACMNACERVFYYTTEIPQEAPRTLDEVKKDYASSESTSKTDSSTTFHEPWMYALAANEGKADAFPPNWPSKGAIELHNMKMRYRSNTPLVLKGLSVSIAGGERIGVVGRTGSGKSSLFLSLLRLVEPYLESMEDDNKAAEYQAPMLIDGVDVLRIGLKELRSKLGIIPQSPVLFSGTIRTNVDPFDSYTDDQIWAALEQCRMKAAVEAMPGMLQATVSEYGENLSAGMRQMLVLGRALLSQCRILLLDEATSSVDYETDREIQRTIREAFPGCTVLTIAHRINTIMDSDKILVMKDGLVAEFGPPQELLQDTTSSFSEIARNAQNSAE